MSARRDCGWWYAVFRLGLAPRWHQLTRLVVANPLRISRTAKGSDVAKRKLNRRSD